MAKILVMSCRHSLDLFEDFYGGDGIKIDKKSFREVENIPRGYDVYFLHLPEINIDDLKELREEQQWSWIYGISNAISIYDLKRNQLKEFKGFLDTLFLERGPFSSPEIIIDQIKNPRINN